MFPSAPSSLPKGDNVFDYPNDTVVSYKETVTMLTNFWRNRLVLRTQEFHEAMYRRAEDPQQVIKTTSGAEMSITSICEARKVSLLEARARLATAEKMLAAAEQGDEAVAALWSDENLAIDIVSPIQPSK